jgi:hypothetical protein
MITRPCLDTISLSCLWMQADAVARLGVRFRPLPPPCAPVPPMGGSCSKSILGFGEFLVCAVRL